MERIGRLGDGGKWVCGMSLYEDIPQEKPCVIYSFGVQTESSFGKSLTFRNLSTKIYLTGCFGRQQTDEL